MQRVQTSKMLISPAQHSAELLRFFCWQPEMDEYWHHLATLFSHQSLKQGCFQLDLGTFCLDQLHLYNYRYCKYSHITIWYIHISIYIIHTHTHTDICIYIYNIYCIYMYIYIYTWVYCIRVWLHDILKTRTGPASSFQSTLLSRRLWHLHFASFRSAELEGDASPRKPTTSPWQIRATQLQIW